MHLKGSILLFGLLGALPAVATAQAPQPQGDAGRGAPPAQGGSNGDAPDDEPDEIVVRGAPPRGSVMGDIKPEQTLNAADIRSYGVSSINDLLSELAPQTNAGGGPPVVLLNGRRISSFSEIQDLPTEAIARTEILPEEVSLKYGYAANQKVVNIVLRQRFRAVTGEARGGTTTEGGRGNGTAIADLLRIRGDNRFTLDVNYAHAADLLESQRDIAATPLRSPYSLAGNVTAVPGSGATEIDPALSALAGMPVTVAGVPASAATGRPSLADFVAGANDPSSSDLARYRTLSPSTDNLSVNAVLARALPHNISASLNGRLTLTDSDSLQGLPGASLLLPAGNPFSPFADPVQLYRYLGDAGALGQSVKGSTAHLGLTLNGAMRPWFWSFTGTYDHSETRTSTDRGIDTGGIQAGLVAGDPSLDPFGSLAPALLSARLIDKARSRSDGFTGDLLLSGPLFAIPAGNVTTSIRIGGSQNSFDSRSTRSGLLQSASFSRGIESGQASIDVPVTSRKNNVLGAIGDLSLNANVAAQHLSDFGTLTTLGYGLRWTPIDQVRLIVSRSDDRTAPTGQQINDPTVVTPNSTVFDYLTGQSVFVTQIGGGNPNLLDSERHLTRVSFTLKPSDKRDLTLTATYTRSHTDNPIAAFPSPTPQVEAAFPQRFVRDEDGNLIQIDARPINFLESSSSQLRWGVNFSVPLKSHIQKELEAWRAGGFKPEDRPADLPAFGGRGGRGNRGGGPGGAPGGPQGQATPPGDGTTGQSGAADQSGTPGQEAAGADTPIRPGMFGGGAGGPDGAGPPGGPGGAGPGGGGPGGGGFRGFGGGRGGGGRGGGGGGGGRLQFALFHTWHFTDSVLIAPGTPRLDLLDGAAIGSSGGQPRHELQAQAGYSNNGLGARLSANWQSATHVDGALGAADGTLHFSGLTTASLRLFANFGQMPKLVRDHPFLRGARLTLSVNNLFNTRQDVTDATGATPVRYQPDYLDPLGRTVTIGFRKLFF